MVEQAVTGGDLPFGRVQFLEDNGNGSAFYYLKKPEKLSARIEPATQVVFTELCCVSSFRNAKSASLRMLRVCSSESGQR